MLPKLSVAGDLSYSSSRQTVPHARSCDSKTTDAAVPTASQYEHLGEPHAVSLVRAVNRAHHCTSVASAAAEAAAASQSVSHSGEWCRRRVWTTTTRPASEEQSTSSLPPATHIPARSPSPAFTISTRSVASSYYRRASASVYASPCPCQ